MAGDVPDPEREPSFREAFAAAAQKSRLSGVKPGEAPSGSVLLGAVGGIRGLIEAILPGLGFLVLYTITKDLWISVIGPFAIAVVFIVVRAIQRQPVMPAITGAIGIALSAALALFTGNISNNFLLGFVINGVAVIALVVSLLVRRPLVGAIIGLLTGDEHWRHDAAKLRIAYVTTVLWLLLSALRLAVQVPLYVAKLPDALAATKLLMGVPLYLGLLWVTWMLVRTAWQAADDPAEDDSQDAPERV
ncbi:MAG TPA: DUF3159 domain-containing protein [Pseudolysinimonas sp.]|jgi:hypothetical protein|nr:DUF3159 domain-containing protein [Pseudolysinimonas sp.]